MCRRRAGLNPADLCYGLEGLDGAGLAVDAADQRGGAIELGERGIERSVPAGDPSQHVEAFLDGSEPSFIDGDLVGMAAGVQGKLAEPVDHRIGLLEQCRQSRIDGGKISTTAKRAREPVGRGLLVAGARLGECQGTSGDPAGMSEPQSLGLQLRVLAGADAQRSEIINEVAGPLQLGGTGARRPPGKGDGVLGIAPGLDRGGGGRSRRRTLVSAGGVEHIALPAPAQHAVARPLSGHVDAEVA